MRKGITMENYKAFSYDIRKNIVDIIVAGGGGHIGGDMSVTDILLTLYFRVMNISPENIREFPILPCYKDWNDALLGKTNPEYLKETEGLVNPIEVRHSGQDEEERQTSYHR